MLGKKYVSIEIGSKLIKIVFIKFNKNYAELLGYALIDTPIDSIVDGKITNIDSLVKVIKDTLRSKKIREKKLILAISGNGVIARDIQIPKSTDEEIESMLGFEAQQYFPVNLENYTMDYKSLEEIETPDGINNRIFMVAVPNSQVDEYLKLSDLLKMDLVSIDYAVNGLLKLLNFVNPISDEIKGDTAILEFGANMTGMFIFSENVLKLYRYLQFGGSDIDKIIAEENKISFEQAEELKKKKLNIIEEDFLEEYLSVSMSDAVKQSINAFLRDIERLFDFYNSRASGKRVKKIYICGGGSKLKGLKEYVSNYLNMPVEIIKYENSVAEKIRNNSNFSDIQYDFTFLINTLGIAIR